MPRISLMQGRLLPPFEDRFQAYPAQNWTEEFYKAKELGLYSIEWIYEKPHESENMLKTDAGISDLKKIMNETGVIVKSICADYYMTQPLIKDGNILWENWEHLEWLFVQAKKMDIAYIILPFVDSSSLTTQEERDFLVSSLREFLLKNKNLDIEIHLEADFKPHDFQNIFRTVNHPYLKMNYDTGNSASLGYNPDIEFGLLGTFLGSVHIKDRILHGKTVSLGTGNTHFDKCFKWFKKLKFDRWYVLQAARGEKGEELETVSSQMDFVYRYDKKI